MVQDQSRRKMREQQHKLMTNSPTNMRARTSHIEQLLSKKSI